MKKTIILLSLFVACFAANSQITAVPDTLKFGKMNNVVFSGNGINFSQGTCIYVFLVQGSDVIMQDASSTYQAGANILNATFTLGSYIVTGAWDVYFVDICSGSWTGNPLTSPGAVASVYLKKMAAAKNAIVNLISQLFDFNLFPNPVTKSNCTISTNSPTLKNNTVNIRDLSGKSIRQFSYSGSEMEINTSELTKGIYFVEMIDSKGQKKTKKMIVE